MRLEESRAQEREREVREREEEHFLEWCETQHRDPLDLDTMIAWEAINSDGR